MSLNIPSLPKDTPNILKMSMSPKYGVVPVPGAAVALKTIVLIGSIAAGGLAALGFALFSGGKDGFEMPEGCEEAACAVEAKCGKANSQVTAARAAVLDAVEGNQDEITTFPASICTVNAKGFVELGTVKLEFTEKKKRVNGCWQKVQVGEANVDLSKSIGGDEPATVYAEEGLKAEIEINKNVLIQPDKAVLADGGQTTLRVLVKTASTVYEIEVNLIRKEAKKKVHKRKPRDHKPNGGTKIPNDPGKKRARGAGRM